MKIGVVVAQGFWLHFKDIFQELEQRHQVAVFQFRRWPYQLMSERLNRLLLKRALTRFMRANDLVFFEWGEEIFVQATRLPRQCRIVVRVHLHELWDFAPQADWSRVARVILVSRAMKRKFQQRFPDTAGRLEVVHNGVRLDRFKPAPRQFGGVIGTLGRIEPHKRLYDLVLVLRELRRRGGDFRLKIGGSCTEPRYHRYTDEVRLLSRRLDVEPWVDFDGQIEDTPAWLQGLDIFISHSVSEGLQVALLEAMASGCYCLAHRWDGADEALPAENLYWSEAELVEKIERFAAASRDEQHAAQQTLRALAVAHFDINIQKMKVVEIIEKTLAEGIAG